MAGSGEIGVTGSAIHGPSGEMGVVQQRPPQEPAIAMAGSAVGEPRGEIGTARRIRQEGIWI